jgi:copper chaperone
MIEFKVPDMSCSHCASVITKTVKQVDPQATIEIDLSSHTVKVDSTEDRASLADALAEAGYPAA